MAKAHDYASSVHVVCQVITQRIRVQERGCCTAQRSGIAVAEPGWECLLVHRRDRLRLHWVLPGSPTEAELARRYRCTDEHMELTGGAATDRLNGGGATACGATTHGETTTVEQRRSRALMIYAVRRARSPAVTPGL